MIQIPLPLSAAAPAGIVPVVGAEGDRDETADFAAILALGMLPDAALAAPAAQGAPLQPGLDVDQADGKSGGKILPVGLPGQPGMTEAEAEAAEPTCPEPRAIAPLLLAMAPPPTVPSPIAPAASQTPAPRAGASAPTPPVQPAPAATVTLPATVQPADPAEAPAAPGAAPRQAPAIQAAGREVTLPASGKPVELPHAPTAATAPEVETPVPAAPTARTLALTEPIIASGRKAPAPATQPAKPLPAPLPEGMPAPMAATQVPPPLASGTAPALGTPAPGVQPHDFAALVDRLVEARTFAQAGQGAQVIHTTIAHAEFGTVSLRFDAGGDGLSVALSSPDPEFNRAVLAAAPAAAYPDAGSLSGRHDGQPSAQNPMQHGAQSQGHDGQPGQRASAPAERPRDPDWPAAADGQDRPDDRKGGIFA